MSAICLSGGTVYDPANESTPTQRDIWIDRGVIIPAPITQDISFKKYDCRGLAIMPGGIDIHAHIAGPKVNVARKLRPEDRRDSLPFHRTELLRSGTRGSTPSTFATGYMYAGLGYTTVFDAAIPPFSARHTHEEFHDTPVIDKGFFILVGNNEFALERIAQQDQQGLNAFLAWMLQATGGYALKIVNPGGVVAWKGGHRGDTGLDEPVAPYGITARQIVSSITNAGNQLRLPHAIHIHCNRLGLPGNWMTTLETMKAVDGLRAHLTHIQFHSYGGDGIDQATFCSKTPELTDYFNQHPELTTDVGQVLFGETTSMTGDGPLGHYLHRVTGRKWFNGEVECEAGCGIVPITYRDKSLINSLQWAIGMEWFLLVNDPWRVALSTDHPNGASFMAYPEIIASLMNREYRRDILKRLPEKLRERCVLPDLDREYTLMEIAIITRAGPARMLGLTNKGHLAPGADADITIYSPNSDIKAMFSFPRYVFKKGVLVVEDGEIRSVPFGPTYSVKPEYDADFVPTIRDWFDENYSIRFGNYAVSDEYLSHGQVVVPVP